MRIRDLFFVTMLIAVVAFFIVGAFTFSSGDTTPDVVEPTHTEINYPINARPLDLQCGDKPCVIFADPDLGAIVALMPDGSTITIKPEEAEESSY